MISAASIWGFSSLAKRKIRNSQRKVRRRVRKGLYVMRRQRQDWARALSAPDSAALGPAASGQPDAETPARAPLEFKPGLRSRAPRLRGVDWEQILYFSLLLKHAPFTRSPALLMRRRVVIFSRCVSELTPVLV